MIELLFTVCLLGADNKATDQCEPRSMQLAEENLTPFQCAMQAQPTLAKWAIEHPRYVITRFGCKPFDSNNPERGA
jgi:hypothetical protein